MTTNTAKICVMAFVVSLVATASASGQQAPSVFDQFAAADTRAKGAILVSIADHSREMQPGDLRRVLAVGLLDNDSTVRLVALSAVSSRAGGIRLKETSDVRSRWMRERPALQALKPQVKNALEDVNERVRLEAIIALVNLGYALDGPKVGIPLTPDVVSAIASRYGRETSPLVRIEIMKTLAISGGDAAAKSATIIEGLSDSDAGVLMYAIRGAAKLSMANSVPRIVDLLKHRERGVRLQAALALGQFKALASPFLGSIREALTVESDPTVRSTLEAVVRSLEG